MYCYVLNVYVPLKKINYLFRTGFVYVIKDWLTYDYICRNAMY